MKENKRKKVVIIDDIYSDTIEQAIFILRSGGVIEQKPGVGTSFLKEAQSIINAYAHTMERSEKRASCRERKGCKEGMLRRAAGVFMVLLGALSVIWLMYRLFTTILH